MDFSYEYELEDPSGNEHFFLPYDTSMYTDINDIKRSDNVSETIEDYTQDEYKKFKAIKVYLNSYCTLLQLNKCFNHMLPFEMVEKIPKILCLL